MVYRLLAVATVLLALPASDAWAGLVEVRERTDPHAERSSLIYTATGSERNTLRIRTTAGSPQSLRVEDQAGVTPGSGCARVPTGDSTVAICTAPHVLPMSLVAVSVGAGDDFVDIESLGLVYVTFSGGRGHDVLHGPPYGTNRFAGGPGDDVMVGGFNRDFFDEGRDRRRNGRDWISGGEGKPTVGLGDTQEDWVDYRGRRAAVHADLDGDRDDGERGEGDRISADIEGLVGGSGPDRLEGAASDDRLLGGPGFDTLLGRGGSDSLIGTVVSNDGALVRGSGDRLYGGSGGDFLGAAGGGSLLVGGPGADGVLGSAGADRIVTRDGWADLVTCRAGYDRLDQDRLDFHRGCERSRPQPWLAVVFRLGWDADRNGARSAELGLGCPGPLASPCQGSVRFEEDGETLLEVPFDIGRWDVANPTPPIDGRLAALIERHDPGLVLTVRTRGRGSVRVRASRVGPLAAGTLFSGPDSP